MVTKTRWEAVEHARKLELLQQYNDSEIVAAYSFSDGAATKVLARERKLWTPDRLGPGGIAGKPPTKETVIGSWRDLNRAEALLELTDNSIDAWMRRKSRYPLETAEKLKIDIELDTAAGILTYEDNAGGVARENLPNLVIPSYSETSDTDSYIGSYRTGGKKAIFKLAAKASISTRYWNPVGTSTEVDASVIHLDSDWLRNTSDYEFPWYPLLDTTTILNGQTRYAFELRDGESWDADAIRDIVREIRRTYTLLMLRHPQVEIYFNDRSARLAPLEDLYKFSGTVNATTDIRPQRVVFTHSFLWNGQNFPLRIEFVLGCRTTSTASRGDADLGEEDAWGIDLYGNDRLFVHHEQEEIPKWFKTQLPAGVSRNLLRGYVNIVGPNVFIPWDTHKRHLNTDREVVSFIRTEQRVKDLFRNWGDVYRAVAGTKVEATVSTRWAPWKGKSWEESGDLNVQHSQNLVSASTSKKWPELDHVPRVPSPRKTATSTPIELRLKLTKAEFRQICATFGLKHRSVDLEARRAAADAVKNYVLSLK